MEPAIKLIHFKCACSAQRPIEYIVNGTFPKCRACAGSSAKEEEHVTKYMTDLSGIEKLEAKNESRGKYL